MERVAIIGGTRTPFVRAGGVFSDQSFLDLGTHAVKSLIAKLEIQPSAIEELIYGTVLLDPRMPNAARELVLRSGLPATIPAHFISNNCISGLVAINMIAEGIRSGRISCGVAGGSESMSRPSLSLHPKSEKFFLALARARTLTQKLKILAGFRPKYLLPQPPSPKEPSTGLTMGQHCEITAKEFAISREVQDRIALASHTNAAKAQSAGYLAEEITPLGKIDRDNLIRADTSLERLEKLAPVFDRSPQGTLTAGNSSALTDGASAVLLMSEKRARQEGREILGYLEMTQYAAIAPSDGLLMAPGLALPKLMQRSNLNVGEIDLFEIHEAFAAQVAANLAVWEQGWQKFPELKPIGKIPTEKINVNGGSIAIGHPFAATGGRLVVSLLNQLKRGNQRQGVISVCAAGAMACAMLLRRN